MVPRLHFLILCKAFERETLTFIHEIESGTWNLGFNSCLVVALACCFPPYTSTWHLALPFYSFVKGKETRMPWYMKLNWLLYNLSNATCLVITLAYWVFLWRGKIGIIRYICITDTFLYNHAHSYNHNLIR